MQRTPPASFPITVPRDDVQAFPNWIREAELLFYQPQQHSRSSEHASDK